MKSSEVKIFSVVLVLALVLVGLAVKPMLDQNRQRQILNKPVPRPSLTRETLVTPGSPMKGDPKAKTTIVVFSDFQCPTCQEGVQVVDEILETKKGRVNTVFHHFQARPDHQWSRVLSRAAYAAGKQGKFWLMHDVLFNKQKDLTASETETQLMVQLREYAKSIGLDMIRFDSVMAKKDEKFFDADMELGDSIRLPGTPTYFVIDPQGNVKQIGSIAALKTWASEMDTKPAS